MSTLDLDKRMALGIAWNGMGRIFLRLVLFVATVVLARLLSPKDFGLVGMAGLFVNFVAMFSDLGFQHALIQRLDVSQEQITTVFWTGILASLVVWVACIAVAPGIALVFRNAAVGPIVAISGAGLVINALGLTQRALIIRRMDFRTLARVDICGALAYGIVSVVMAVMGFGAWSLVIGGVAMMTTTTILLWLVGRWRPSWKLDIAGSRDLFHFGVRVLAYNIVNYARLNLDYLIVGAFLGPVPLGFYTIAFKIADFPRNRLTPIVTDVAFPVMSSVQETAEEMRRTYRKTLALVSTAVFPMLVGLAAVSREFVGVLYGQKWLPAVLPLEILLLMGVMITQCDPATTVLLATGRPGLQLKLSTVYAVVLGVLAVAMVRFGNGGVALAVLLATFLYFVLVQHRAVRAMRLRAHEYIRAVGPAMLGCVAMAIVVLAYKRVEAATPGFPEVLWLVSAIALGVMTYVFVISLVGGNEATKVVRHGLRSIGNMLRLIVPTGRTQPVAATDDQESLAG